MLNICLIYALSKTMDDKLINYVNKKLKFEKVANIFRLISDRGTNDRVSCARISCLKNVSSF